MANLHIHASIRGRCPHISMGHHNGCPKASITFRALLCLVSKGGIL